MKNMTPPRRDYGYSMLMQAIEDKVVCEFTTKRSRNIRGVPLSYDESFAKLIILETQNGRVVTEILRGDISSITCPAEVIRKLAELNHAVESLELQQNMARGLRNAHDAGYQEGYHDPASKRIMVSAWQRPIVV